jgi:son of sevenless-like protein
LEDTLEMTEDGNYPAVGSCFEELAEGEEFDVYDKYAQVTIIYLEICFVFS